MASPKLFTYTVLAASALALSTPALAESKTTQVRYEDLDLSTPRGQERLKTRVKQAVKQVCGSPRAITLQERLDQSKCETRAMARALPKADKQIAAYVQTRQLASSEAIAIIGN